eukprot:scaffold4066_cov417-Prasinococcus_capsulatus_cf.AAC.8
MPLRNLPDQLSRTGLGAEGRPESIKRRFGDQRNLAKQDVLKSCLYLQDTHEQLYRTEEMGAMHTMSASTLRHMAHGVDRREVIPMPRALPAGERFRRETCAGLNLDSDLPRNLDELRTPRAGNHGVSRAEDDRCTSHNRMGNCVPLPGRPTPDVLVRSSTAAVICTVV